jgi:hypothetical protein
LFGAPSAVFVDSRFNPLKSQDSRKENPWILLPFVWILLPPILDFLPSALETLPPRSSRPPRRGAIPQQDDTP